MCFLKTEWALHDALYNQCKSNCEIDGNKNGDTKMVIFMAIEVILVMLMLLNSNNDGYSTSSRSIDSNCHCRNEAN